MDKIGNKPLLGGDKFMPEMHLKQPGFTYSAACEPFNIKKERIKKFKEIGDSRFIYQNELDKACFQHSACGPFTKNKNIKKFTETEDSRYIYQSELDKACF